MAVFPSNSRPAPGPIWTGCRRTVSSCEERRRHRRRLGGRPPAAAGPRRGPNFRDRAVSIRTADRRRCSDWIAPSEGRPRVQRFRKKRHQRQTRPRLPSRHDSTAPSGWCRNLIRAIQPTPAGGKSFLLPCRAAGSTRWFRIRPLVWKASRLSQPPARPPPARSSHRKLKLPTSTQAPHICPTGTKPVAIQGAASTADRSAEVRRRWRLFRIRCWFRLAKTPRPSRCCCACWSPNPTFQRLPKVTAGHARTGRTNSSGSTGPTRQPARTRSATR